MLCLLLLGGSQDVVGQSFDLDSLRLLLSAQAPIYRDFSEPVDPDLYVIRPADVITATFVGTKIPSQSFTINPEGFLIEQSLGKIKLAGMSLTAARNKLTESLARIYNMQDIAFSISRPRLITISVTGEVALPGAYTLYTSQRVSEAIAAAGGVTGEGSTRKIMFYGGAKPLPVDLDRARYLGDLDFDPLLYAGTRIVVPARSQEVVHVVGEVNTNRSIEYLPTDSLDLLLALAGGTTGYADRSAVKVIDGAGSTLKPGVTILVPPKSNMLAMQAISIFGAISNPGRYDTSGIHTLGDLLKAAGGFTPPAVQERTVVFRRVGTNEVGQISNVRYPIVFTDQRVFEPGSFAVRPGDSVIVPVAHGYVHVSGAVRNPGIVPFVPDKSVDWYIKSVGGFLPRADKEQLLIHHPVANIMAGVTLQTMVRDGDEIRVEVREEFK